MSGNELDDLIAEAEAARDEEVGSPNAELGDAMTPEPEGQFTGRWRGEGTMVTTDRGAIGVFHVWGLDGKPGFLYKHAKLVQEVSEQAPQVGDLVVVLRGVTREYEKDGEPRTSYPYVLRRRECADPLPVEPGESDERTGDGQLDPDADLPF